MTSTFILVSSTWTLRHAPSETNVYCPDGLSMSQPDLGLWYTSFNPSVSPKNRKAFSPSPSNRPSSAW
jgi:hypothetical protein